MKQLILLGTEHCHLCDKARDELASFQLFSKIPFKFEYLDIVEHEEWYQRYELEIPVLLTYKGERSVRYPFQFNDVMALLNH